MIALFSLTYFFFSASFFLLSAQAVELRGEGDSDPVSIRILTTVDEVYETTSLAYAGGEEVQLYASDKCCVLRDTPAFPASALAGPDQGPETGAAAVTPKDGVSMDAGGEMASSPVTETLEGPEGGHFISACLSKNNMSEQNGDQRVSQHQVEALRTTKEKKKTPTKRPSHSGREREDQSILRSHGSTQGEQKEKDQNSPGAQDRVSHPQEENSLHITQKGSKSSQKSGGDDPELVPRVGSIIQRSVPSSLPHSAALRVEEGPL